MYYVSLVYHYRDYKYLFILYYLLLHRIDSILIHSIRDRFLIKLSSERSLLRIEVTLLRFYQFFSELPLRMETDSLVVVI